MTNVQPRNRQFGCESIHPTQNSIQMNFFAKVLHDKMGIIFDLQGCGCCQMPKMQSHYIEDAQGGVSSSAIHNHTQF